MARNLALLAFGVVVGVVAGAALQIHAAEGDGMGEGADLTGVDGSDQGGRTADVVPDLTVESPRAQQPEPPAGVWDRLAACESSGNWHIEGRTYSGGLQFDAQTWLSYGGGAYASRASLATRGQQIAVAERLRAARGYQPWPVCSRVIGVR